MPLPSEFVAGLRAIVGDDHVRMDAASRDAYGADALKQGHPADAVVLPRDAEEISAIMKLCGVHRIPVVPRGAGTGTPAGRSRRAAGSSSRSSA